MEENQEWLSIVNRTNEIVEAKENAAAKIWLEEFNKKMSEFRASRRRKSNNLSFEDYCEIVRKNAKTFSIEITEDQIRKHYDNDEDAGGVFLAYLDEEEEEDPELTKQREKADRILASLDEASNSYKRQVRKFADRVLAKCPYDHCMNVFENDKKEV